MHWLCESCSCRRQPITLPILLRLCCDSGFAHLFFVFFPSRWPKWRLPGPSLRTPTIRDPALSRTQPSRANWSLPNTAASYSSGTGETAEASSATPCAPSKGSQTMTSWRVSVSPEQRANILVLLLDGAHVPTVSSSAAPPALVQCLRKIKEGWTVWSKVHASIMALLATSVNVMSEQTRDAVIIVVK